jgi:hypothetical protein
MTAIGIDQPSPRSSAAVQNLLLGAGVASSVVYLTADLLCGLRYPGYRFGDQTISELSALGSPTAALWATLLRGYALLFVGFTIGVFREGRANRRLRVTAWLLIVFALTGPLWSFVPMHQRGDVFTWSDVGHIALGGVTVILMTAVILVGSDSLGTRFRAFSRLIAGVVLVAGASTFAYVPRMIDQQPTPWLGVIERMCLYGFLLWSAVLAIAVIRQDTSATHAAGARQAWSDAAR